LLWPVGRKIQKKGKKKEAKKTIPVLNFCILANAIEETGGA
jgi:hypothetical protein